MGISGDVISGVSLVSPHCFELLDLLAESGSQTLSGGKEWVTGAGILGGKMMRLR